MADTNVDRVVLEIDGDSKGATQSIQFVKDGLKGFAKYVSGPIANSIQSTSQKIRRIVEYRLIRGGFSKLIQGLEQGKKNIEAYDQALKGLSFSRAAQYMAEMAQNATLLKNTLASAFMTTYALIKPAIDGIVQLIRGALNVFNQFISAMMGREGYTKAVAGISDVTKSVKDLKRQIFGFDELNILNGNNGNAGASFEDMFEEAQIDSRIKTVADKIRQLFNIEELKIGLTEIGAILLGWRLAPGLFDGLKLLAAFNIPVLKAAMAAAGAETAAAFSGAFMTAIMAGLGLAAAGIALSIKNGISWGSAALTIAGLALAGAFIGALTGIGPAMGALIGAGIGAVINGIIALCQNNDIKAWAEEQKRIIFENFNPIISKIREAIDAIKEYLGLTVTATETEGGVGYSGGNAETGRRQAVYNDIMGIASTAHQVASAAGRGDVFGAITAAIRGTGEMITNAVNAKDMSLKIGDRVVSASAKRGSNLNGNSLIHGSTIR